MRDIELQPNQIIVPGEYELGNESILKIYFRVFDRGHGGDLPPAIVTTAGSFERLQDRLEECYEEWQEKFPAEVEARRKDYNSLFALLKARPYFLVDGNHKSAAATLTHNPIHALELQSSKDIAELKRMIKRGELFDFKRPERNLDDLRLSFVGYCLGVDKSLKYHTLPSTTSSLIRYTKTIRQRIDKLVSSRDLPKYMIDRYRQGKKDTK